MTPDWRALVAEVGAGPGVAEPAVSNPVVCYISDGDSIIMVGQLDDGRAFWRTLGMRARYCETAKDAIRAALNHLRAELRARMERDAAALRRLGGGE